jgi:hypothetical protein
MSLLAPRPSSLNNKLSVFRTDEATGSVIRGGFTRNFFYNSFKYLEILADCCWRRRDCHILPGDLGLER